MSELAYQKSRYRPPEIEHRYGPNVHLLDDPLAWTLLARRCARDTFQPDVGRLVRSLYERLAGIVVAAELPRVRVDVPTRMVSSSPEAVYRGQAIAPHTKVVTVGIARAGTMPSQVVYELLNEVLDPAGVRQDHLFMSRTTDAHGQVTGVSWHDAKIGRDVEDRVVLVPDPMGATGGSLVSALTHYKHKLEGAPGQCITMHLIITPEYVKNVLAGASGDDHSCAASRSRAQRAGACWGRCPGRSGTKSAASTSISTSCRGRVELESCSTTCRQ